MKTTRFPTHEIVLLGLGFSAVNVYHTLSRANGNGKSVLEKNGHENVKLMTLRPDWEVIFRMNNFMKEYTIRYNNGSNPSEAVSFAPFSLNCVYINIL